MIIGILDAMALRHSQACFLFAVMLSIDARPTVAEQQEDVTDGALSITYGMHSPDATSTWLQTEASAVNDAMLATKNMLIRSALANLTEEPAMMLSSWIMGNPGFHIRLGRPSLY